MRPRIQSVIQPADLNEITSQSWTLLNLRFSFPMNGCRWNEVYRKNTSNSLVLVVFHDQKLAAKLRVKANFRFLVLFNFEILHVLRKCLLGPFPLNIDDCNAFNKFLYVSHHFWDI